MIEFRPRQPAPGPDTGPRMPARTDLRGTRHVLPGPEERPRPRQARDRAQNGVVDIKPEGVLVRDPKGRWYYDNFGYFVRIRAGKGGRREVESSGPRKIFAQLPEADRKAILLARRRRAARRD